MKHKNLTGEPLTEEIISSLIAKFSSEDIWSHSLEILQTELTEHIDALVWEGFSVWGAEFEHETGIDIFINSGKALHSGYALNFVVSYRDENQDDVYEECNSLQDCINYIENDIIFDC